MLTNSVCGGTSCLLLLLYYKRWMSKLRINVNHQCKAVVTVSSVSILFSGCSTCLSCELGWAMAPVLLPGCGTQMCLAQSHGRTSLQSSTTWWWVYMREGAWLSLWAQSERIRGSGRMLKQGRIWLDTRKKPSPLPRWLSSDTGWSRSLGNLHPWLVTVLNDQTCSWQGWDCGHLAMPSSPSGPGIFWSH